MNEDIPSSSKEIIEAAKVAKEVIPQTITEADGAISTLLGLFNHVVLYPVKKANIFFQYNLACFEKDLKRKLGEIPAGNICEPRLMIAGPALEALKYSYDEQELRKMFVNLLASSMNRDKTESTHPSFVQIINQLSPLDAKLISLFRYRATYPCIEVIEKQSNGKITPMVHAIFDFYQHNNDFDANEFLKLTMSLDNLMRLGLISKNRRIIELDYNYEILKGHFLYSAFISASAADSELVMEKFRIELTELGRAFKITCLD